MPDTSKLPPRPKHQAHHEAEEMEEEQEYEGSSAGEYEEEDDFPNALLRVLTTEEGESIADVLKGIQGSLSQQAKVLYKLAQVLEKSSKK